MNWCTVCICLPLFVKLDQHCLPELTSMIELFSNQCCPIWNTIATCGNWVLENEELVCTLYLIFNTFNCHMWLLATIMDNMYLDNCIFPLGKDIYIYYVCFDKAIHMEMREQPLGYCYNTQEVIISSISMLPKTVLLPICKLSHLYTLITLKWQNINKCLLVPLMRPVKMEKNKIGDLKLKEYRRYQKEKLSHSNC